METETNMQKLREKERSSKEKEMKNKSQETFLRSVRATARWVKSPTFRSMTILSWGILRFSEARQLLVTMEGKCQTLGETATCLLHCPRTCPTSLAPCSRAARMTDPGSCDTWQKLIGAYATSWLVLSATDDKGDRGFL